jgi:peroxiredoxin
MNIALLIARLLLAVVFVVAGLTKLADRAGSRRALIDFGVPARLATPGGLLLPLAELAVAVALIPLVTAWWGAVGALALLALFIGGISINLARGRKPDCHCFGQLYSKPIGWSTLIRNVVLAAVAGLIVGLGWSNVGLSATDWFGLLTVSSRIELIAGVILVALLFGIGWLLLAIMQQQGRLLLRIEALEARLTAVGSTPPAPAVDQPGLPVGTVAPAFALSGLYGETLTLEALKAASKPMVLLFSDPGCGPCTALMPEVGRWQREYMGKLTLAVISRGTPQANRAKASEHGVTQVLLQKDREVAETYTANGTPAAVIVRPDGTIGSPLAMGADAIRALVAQAVGLPALHAVPATPTNGNAIAVVPTNGIPAAQVVPTKPKVGDLAPAFALPNLNGKMVNLSDFRGSKTLVLFWRPSCGFCQRMLDDLKAWETQPPKGAPKLLVVSTDSLESNQAMGLRSTVVLDAGEMSVGSKFGANGTPMAVLVDAQGKIASELAIGAPAVLKLADPETAAAPSTLVPANTVNQPTLPKAGDPAPDFSLPDLTGKTTKLTHFRGSKMLVLFWDPACGFCQQMLDELKAWEAQPPKGAPKLLVVSRGTKETNQALGLRSRILLDADGMNVGSKFGANGTPMAVLVDAQGKITSNLAAGKQEVLALAGAGNEILSEQA